VDAEKIEEVVFLHFIKWKTEAKMMRPSAKGNIVDVLIEFVIMRRVLADISPENNFTGLLVHIQGLHHQHDILDVV
jgi:hypothetical protein